MFMHTPAVSAISRGAANSCQTPGSSELTLPDIESAWADPVLSISIVFLHPCFCLKVKKKKPYQPYLYKM